MSLRWRINTMLVRGAVAMLKATGWYDGYWNHWRGKPFNYAQARGLHILPVHYYTPIPDTTTLNGKHDDAPSSLTGINLNLGKSLAFLESITTPYRNEFAHFPRHEIPQGRAFTLKNGAYSAGDAEVLYSMVRHIRPSKIIEIGAGNSTFVIADALRLNQRETLGTPTEFVSIEPYPPPYLQPPPPELTRLIAAPLQAISLDEFDSLNKDDILFIDSSHVSRAESDVNYEFLELLPRLNPGVIVHVHDIFLPWDYPPEWIQASRFFWNEQYLLQAFLAFNRDFEVILPLHALARVNREATTRLIPSIADFNARPSAFWMRRANRPSQ
jgi:hypothetical protein